MQGSGGAYTVDGSLQKVPPTCGAFSKDFLSKEKKKDGTAYGINQGRKQEPLSLC